MRGCGVLALLAAAMLEGGELAGLSRPGGWRNLGGLAYPVWGDTKGVFGSEKPACDCALFQGS